MQGLERMALGGSTPEKLKGDTPFSVEPLGGVPVSEECNLSEGVAEFDRGCAVPAHLLNQTREVLNRTVH